ncbi:cyclic nucleotide-binding/CBS domain-containing protein [Noviherbaspirillum sp. ST9]|uniref:CBS domain-containing protein n=1 Tax=Noviherbaspirillum sp. ST9 TaxID=3401606 RepID=UPI003B58B39B
MAERTLLESIPRRPILSAAPHSSAYDAACRMSKAGCGSVLVLSPDGALVGIFTERDLMTRVVALARPPESTPLSEVMTPNPQVVGPQTSVHNAVVLMRQAGIRHLPILSSNAILGVFSIRDALPTELRDADHLLDHLDQQFSDVLA